MKKKQLTILVMATTAILIVNFIIRQKTSTAFIGLDEIEALACGENGCTKNFSKVEIRELTNGKTILYCDGCGSLKCEKPEWK